jgi:hypothetical protein
MAEEQLTQRGLGDSKIRFPLPRLYGSERNLGFLSTFPLLQNFGKLRPAYIKTLAENGKFHPFRPEPANLIVPLFERRPLP